MRQVRIRTFETNSSSTHSMIIAMADEFDKWVNGDYFIDWDKHFITKEEVYKKYEEEVTNKEELPFDEWINTWESELWDYDGWCEDEYLEVDENTYTTPNGEVIKILCKYGTDY